MSGPLMLMATFVAQPSAEAELRRRLLEMVVLTRREQGCLHYDLHEVASSPDRFVFIETWASKEAWLAHEDTVHVQQILRDAPALTAGPIEVVELRPLEATPTSNAANASLE